MYMDVQYHNPWYYPQELQPGFLAMNNLNMNIDAAFAAELEYFDTGSFRSRSNTWPLPRPENFPPDQNDDNNGSNVMEIGSTGNSANSCNSANSGNMSDCGLMEVSANVSANAIKVGGTMSGGMVNGVPLAVPTVIGSTKKNSSRRNAWGNLSYADLITQAITSAPDKRLTLSQIYEWMVQNVPYFKDKGDSNSSAGWKNSIRHNLSLHNRFMRVQNEGTGKSSWWMINPDAKPGKSVRRRAASMETSKYEKRRGRVKKKVEALRNGLVDTTPSPSSSVSEGLDLFPDSPLHSGTGFQLSPDFRPRASSATSSCGRLSPIPAILGLEPDWIELSENVEGTGSTSSLVNCPGFDIDSDNTLSDTFKCDTDEVEGGGVGATNCEGSYSPDQLAGNLEQGMKLENDIFLQGFVSNSQTPQHPPPAYPTSFEATYTAQRDINSLRSSTAFGINVCPIHRMQHCGCLQTQCKIENLSPPSGMSPSYPQSDSSASTADAILSHHSFLIHPTSMSGSDVDVADGSSSSITRHRHPNNRISSLRRSPSSSPPLTNSVINIGSNPNRTHAHGLLATTMMGQLMGALQSTTSHSSTILDDIDIKLESLDGGFECNVDELIKHELSMEGSLDFNFSQSNTCSSSSSSSTIMNDLSASSANALLNNQLQQLSQLHQNSHTSNMQQLSPQGAVTAMTADLIQMGNADAQPSPQPAAVVPQQPYSVNVTSSPSWVH